MRLISALFAVEKQGKEFAAEQRLALRRTQSQPVLAELREKLLSWKEQLLPKHPMAEALNYNRRDPGQLDQQLPPARNGSATVLHAAADESPFMARKMISTPGFPIAGSKLMRPDAQFWEYPLSIPDCGSRSRSANTDHVPQMSRHTGNLADVGRQAI